MKRLLFAFTIVVCLLAVSLSTACGERSVALGDAEGGMHVSFPSVKGPTQLEFDLSSVELPSANNMVVYSIVNPVITAHGVEAIGKGFGFIGDAGPSGSSCIGMVDETDGNRRALRAYVASGGIEYKMVDRWFPVVASQPSLPSAEDAERMATEYLRAKGLLPDDAVCGGASESGVQEETTDGRVTQRYVVMLAVKFNRSIEGIPVMGPGQQLTAYVGEGEVTGVNKFWRDVKPYKRVRMRSATEAVSALQAAGKDSCYSANERTKKVAVSSVSIAYWMFAPENYQEHLSPVYEFRGRCLDETGADVGPFLGWSEAVDFAS
jgi:hypothetical protein